MEMAIADDRLLQPPTDGTDKRAATVAVPRQVSFRVVLSHPGNSRGDTNSKVFNQLGKKFLT